MKLKTLVLAGIAAAGLAPAVQAKDVIKMATIAPGTSAYLTMTTMASIVNRGQDEFEVQVDATGAATKHMVEVAQGKLDLSMTSPAVYNFMKSGTRMYKKLKNAPQLAENLRLLFWFPYGTYHFTVYAGEGIERLEDVKGRKVFLGPPGGGAWAAARDWLRATTGYEPGKDFENVKASWSSAFQGFQDRQIDVYTTGCLDPCPQFEQLSVTSRIRFLGVDEAGTKTEAVGKIMVPGREIGVIRAGAYGDAQDNREDVHTLQAAVGVTARVDLDEDTAYALTKVFWDGVAAAREDAPWLDHITIEYAIKEGPMKLHPGALRYYRERGLEIPAINIM